MTLDDVDLDQRIVWVLGKDRRPRALPIGRKTAQALDRYLRAREGHRLGHLPHLWVGRNGPMTPIGDLPGRPRSRSRGRAAGHAPHQLRHAFASSWLAEGGNEDEPMLVAGWKSRAMIDRTPGPRPLSKNRAWQANRPGIQFCGCWPTPTLTHFDRRAHEVTGCGWPRHRPIQRAGRLPHLTVRANPAPSPCWA
jgi:integrase